MYAAIFYNSAFDESSSLNDRIEQTEYLLAAKLFRENYHLVNEYQFADRSYLLCLIIS